MNFAESNFVAKSCDSSIAIERTGADILVDCSSKGVNLLADPDPKVTAEYVSNVFTPTWEFLYQDRTPLLDTDKRGLLHAVVLKETDEVIGYKTYVLVYVDPCKNDFIDITLTPLTTLNA